MVRRLPLRFVVRVATRLAVVALGLAWPAAALGQATRAGGAPRTPPVAAEVERRLVAAAQRGPDSFAAQHALGEFYLHARQIPKAIPFLERARALDPSHYTNGYDLALAYLEVGEPGPAKQLVERMLAVKETGELDNLLGDVVAQAGDFVAAAEAYQKAARLDPTEEHLFDWGDNLLRLRAYDPAVEVFAAAIKRHPDSARLHVGLGIAQYSRGQHEAAVTAFCRAADLAPSDPRPYEFLGEMYGVSPDQGGEITRRLARFVTLRPKDAAGHYYYAMSLWKGSGGAVSAAELARVEAQLRRATVLDPRHAKARLQLGILLSEQRRWPEAIRALLAAVAIEPGLAQAHFRLAQAYRRSGQPALADKELAVFEATKTPEKPAGPPAPVPD